MLTGVSSSVETVTLLALGVPPMTLTLTVDGAL
jgi:hypothetical protein